MILVDVRGYLLHHQTNMIEHEKLMSYFVKNIVIGTWIE